MVYLFGDLHGIPWEAQRRLLAAHIAPTANDVAILLGDVGIKYGDRMFRDMRVSLNELGCPVLVMRGNHDSRYRRDLENHSFCRKGSIEYETIDGCMLAHDMRHPNVWYLPDGPDVVTIEDKRFLLLPGAFSVDKEWRLRTQSPWEPEELLTQAELRHAIDLAHNGDIDYVLSHTAPLCWEPLFDDLFIDGLDESTIDRSMETYFDVILDEVSSTCKGWFFGHFHDDRDLKGTIGHMLYHNVYALDI